MVQVPCPYVLWSSSYVTFTVDTSLAYCRHVILCNVIFFLGDPKIQSEMHISLQELRYGLICILWLFAPFWPMGGHPHVGGPHRIWAPSLCGGSPL